MQNSRSITRGLMRASNKNLILNLIREKAPIAQVGIANVTKLSTATVANIVKELKNEKIIEEVGEGKPGSKGGRRSILLRFNPDARYVIGVEFFAGEMNVAVLNLTGCIKKRVKISTEPNKGEKAVFKKFVVVAEDLLEKSGIKKKDVLGVGVSIEGIVNSNKGELIFSARFGWRNILVKEYIEKELGLHTFVETQGRAMLLGEHWYGAGKGAADVVCIDIDAGIGSNAIWGGRIRRGMHSMAGEIGHILIIPDGLECRCGKRGCLETVASGMAILSKVKQGLNEGKKSIVSPELVNSPSTRIAIKNVFDAAKQGDKFALEVINEAGYYLGLITAAVINDADPELVILTGCVIYESQGMLLKIIRDVAHKQVVNPKFRTIRVEEGCLGEDAALIGAATLVCRDAFKLPLVHV